MGVIGSILGFAATTAISAAAQRSVNSANASAQSDINRETMDFNASEAAKARDFQAAQSSIDRNFNAQQSLIQREWSERMVNSAHQREVLDLKAAGLNPILSSNYQGSATPTVPVASHATPSSVAASVSGLSAYQRKNIMGEFVSSAREALRLGLDYQKAKIQDKEADAAHKQADAALKNAETNAKSQAVQESKIKAEIESINNSISIALEDLDIRKELKNASVEEKHAMIDKLMSDIDVNREQAAKIGIEKEELERRIRYGTFLSSYLPLEAREIVGNHMIDFVRENKDTIKYFMDNMNGNYEVSDDVGKNIMEKVGKWLIDKGYITNFRK